MIDWWEILRDCLWLLVIDGSIMKRLLVVVADSMQATGTLQGFISSFTELELKMNGIERVKYYSDIAIEKPYEKDEKASLNDP